MRFLLSCPDGEWFFFQRLLFLTILYIFRDFRTRPEIKRTNPWKYGQKQLVLKIQPILCSKPSHVQMISPSQVRMAQSHFHKTLSSHACSNDLTVPCSNGPILFELMPMSFHVRMPPPTFGLPPYDQNYVISCSNDLACRQSIFIWSNDYKFVLPFDYTILFKVYRQAQVRSSPY